MSIQPGPHDLPIFCQRCRQTTLHRPAPDGQAHCLPCMMAAMQQPMAMVRQAEQPRMPPVVQVQQKVGGGIVRSTIDAAKFIAALIFLCMIGTCVYVCGSAGKAAQETQHH